MKKSNFISLIFLLIGISSCNIFNVDLKEIDFELIHQDSFPPCINIYDTEIVLRNIEEYENARIKYPHQGEYEEFFGDEQQTELNLSYKLLDSNGLIDIKDLTISIDGEVTIKHNNEIYYAVANPLLIDLDNMIPLLKDKGNVKTKIKDQYMKLKLIWKILIIALKILLN